MWNNNVDRSILCSVNYVYTVLHSLSDGKTFYTIHDITSQHVYRFYKIFVSHVSLHLVKKRRITFSDTQTSSEVFLDTLDPGKNGPSFNFSSLLLQDLVSNSLKLGLVTQSGISKTNSSRQYPRVLKGSSTIKTIRLTE